MFLKTLSARVRVFLLVQEQVSEHSLKTGSQEHRHSCLAEKGT